jgi:aldose 1-epimerase
VEDGGGVRVFEVAGHEVLESFPVDAMCDGAHGTPLIPWPNRLRDGRYTFDGVDYQVALTEPATRTAIHGLLRWRAWSARAHTQDRVVMGTVLVTTVLFVLSTLAADLAVAVLDPRVRERL